MKSKKTFICLIGFLVLAFSGCVEPIEFEIPRPEDQFIIQGNITDQPGPYRVEIRMATGVTVSNPINHPVEGASVRLYDNEGNIEDFQEVAPGEYETGGAMQGVIGRSYHIRVELENGKTFESVPDELTPVGTISDIHWEFESRTIDEQFGDVQADVFNVFVDSDAGTLAENFVRWRMVGTYRIETSPELRVLVRPWWDIPLPSPRECSGFDVAPRPGGGTTVVQVGPCECCECWVNVFEDSPKVSDDLLVANGEFRNVKVGEVEINNVNFYDKYMISIEQMSLTRTAFDFFRLIEVQRTSASSIFQPPSGEILGNVIASNEDDRVVGLFYASSIDTQVRFIERSEVPYPLTPTQTFPESCLLQFDHSSTERPLEWQ